MVMFQHHGVSAGRMRRQPDNAEVNYQCTVVSRQEQGILPGAARHGWSDLQVRPADHSVLASGAWAHEQ